MSEIRPTYSDPNAPQDDYGHAAARQKQFLSYAEFQERASKSLAALQAEEQTAIKAARAAASTTHKRPNTSHLTRRFFAFWLRLGWLLVKGAQRAAMAFRELSPLAYLLLATTLAVLAIGLAGCSGKQAIADANRTAREAAIEIKADAGTIIAETQSAAPRMPVIETSARNIDRRAGDVERATVRIDENLSRVQDVGGFFSKLMGGVKWLLWAGGLVGLAWLVRAFNLKPILAKIGDWLPLLIPSPVKREAALAVDVLDPSKPEDAREFVAAKRAADPVFDVAVRREKRKRAEGER